MMIGAYALNQQYIAKEFCVNKASKSMHCNGRCYLSKQLNKDEKQGSPFTSGNEKFEIQLFCVDVSSDEINIPEI